MDDGCSTLRRQQVTATVQLQGLGRPQESIAPSMRAPILLNTALDSSRTRRSPILKQRASGPGRKTTPLRCTRFHTSMSARYVPEIKGNDRAARRDLVVQRFGSIQFL